MGEIRLCVCVFVGGCGQGERERLVLRSFSSGLCSRDGWQAELLGEEGFVPRWRNGIHEGRPWGEMGKNTPAQFPDICISLREASATARELSVLKFDITPRGTEKQTHGNTEAQNGLSLKGP